MALATVKTWVKNQPTLEPVVPWLRSLAHAYRCYVKPVLRLCWVVPRDLVYLMFLPYRLHFFLKCVRWLEREGKQRERVPSQWAGPRRIVMLVNSDLRTDPRVQREAQALAAQDFHVTIISPAWSPDPAACRISWGRNIDFRVLSHKAARFNMYYPYLFGREMFDAAMGEDAWAYHAHDLDMSLIALMAAARKEVACVCDFHEWYSENVSYNRWTGRYRPHPFYKRWAYQTMERAVMHTATEVITVCDSIGTDLARVYEAPAPVRIIRNIPQIKTTDRQGPADLRKELGIPGDNRIILYQGGLGPSRNLEPVIAAMARVPHAVFVIRGPGYEHWAKSYYRLASRLGVRDKIFCLPPVPSARVVAEARGADMGLWTLLADVGLNFKYSLPNKVFEYMAAGVPLLVADLPEVRKIVVGYEIGVCFDPVCPASIARAMNRLADDTALSDRCRGNIARAVRELGADQEWNKLVELYRHLGQRN
jgi:glycosyltransferase involved in cell wall biosynthesis